MYIHVLPGLGLDGAQPQNPSSQLQRANFLRTVANSQLLPFRYPFAQFAKHQWGNGAWRPHPTANGPLSFSPQSPHISVVHFQLPNHQKQAKIRNPLRRNPEKDRDREREREEDRAKTRVETEIGKRRNKGKNNKGQLAQVQMGLKKKKGPKSTEAPNHRNPFLETPPKSRGDL